ncbi:hypothetical protein [Pseudomonas weihenstephanensis]|uniref:hypothetical protein n=1 Tax=Pseudomonas weihenstephanensis TaxID=1608994 RepID=UPI00193C04C8|nr:hypothetical protein [Pseudomonas weihenstephanensis]MBM1191575.1 hypothetical protein [Pseudomonas weihenstephanensis]
MNFDSDVERFLVQLVRETSIGNLSWSITPPHYFLENATEDLIPLNIGASYNGLQVSVYEARYKYYRDEDEWFWTSEIRFSIVKNDTLVVDYRRPSAPLQQLFEMARSQAVGFDSIFRNDF